MTVSLGYTAAEIREFVHQYQLQPKGHKQLWLEDLGVSYSTFRRWRDAAYSGDLDRGLVPRQGTGMRISPRERALLESERAREKTENELEVERLARRVKELEASNKVLQRANGTLEKANDALGKAIGLLQVTNEHEPAATPQTPDPSGS